VSRYYLIFSLFKLVKKKSYFEVEEEYSMFFKLKYVALKINNNLRINTYLKNKNKIYRFQILKRIDLSRCHMSVTPLEN